MTPFQRRRTPITGRLADDMTIRNLAAATIDAYTYHVDKFDQFLGEKRIQKATPDDIRDFQLHLIKVREVGQQLQPGRLWSTVSLPRHDPPAVARNHDSFG
jgi:site-specific recombinase XerD